MHNPNSDLFRVESRPHSDSLSMDSDHSDTDSQPSCDNIHCRSVKSANSANEDGEINRIVLGILAMAKKIDSKPMRAILHHLKFTDKFQIVEFDQDMILNQPIEEWPKVECLITFYSSGLPYEKVVSYVTKYKPFLVNDIYKQATLFDRRSMYTILKDNGVPINDYVIYDKSTDPHGVHFREFDNRIEVYGKAIMKPFVEKPFNAEDHYIHIYYGVDDKFGTTRLMRKTKEHCSQFLHESSVRRDRGYIYEPFLQTDGFDIKVYAVGPEYFHAEARKSPVVDTKVQRMANGKEYRYPVILTKEEKEIAKKVVKAFGQFVCGFDLLRCEGKSYVCDVNGWSFVKGNYHYYSDCAKLLRNLIFSQLRPNDRHFPMARSIMRANPCTNHCTRILRSLIGVFRHADRTPKQKLKFVTMEREFCVYCEPRCKSAKLKKPRDLEMILQIANSLLQKPLNKSTAKKYKIIKTILEHDKIEGLNRKVQIKPLKIQNGYVTEVRFILKWGGVLTATGIQQAENLGKHFRSTMYPEEDDFLRLHSTYTHDLKCYSADEGRCQISAAAFLKGFLDLENEIMPIVVSMVRSDQATVRMLDYSKNSSDEISINKRVLSSVMNREEPLDECLREIGADLPESVYAKLAKITNSRLELEKIYKLLHQLYSEIKAQSKQSPDLSAYMSEKLPSMAKRWKKLVSRFYNSENDEFDISQLSTIRDFIRFDTLHNYEIVKEVGMNLFKEVDILGLIVHALEYGLNHDEKVHTSCKLLSRLLLKVNHDLAWWVNPDLDISRERFEDYKGLDTSQVSPTRIEWPFVRTRYYFATLSHLNALLSVIKYGLEKGLLHGKDLTDMMVIEYIGHIVFKLYEDQTLELDDPNRFIIELYISPGMEIRGPEDALSRGLEQIGGEFSLKEMDLFFRKVLGSENEDDLRDKIRLMTSSGTSA